MKKSMIVAALAAVILTAGCSGDYSMSKEPARPRENRSQTSTEEETGSPLEESLEGANVFLAQMRQLQQELVRMKNACQMILKGCSGNLSAGYQVDDAFLSWITANYGEAAVYQLAEAVEQGEEDPELWYTHTGSSIHVLWDSYCRELGIQSDNLERVYWKECASEDAVVLDFIGDINFSEGWSSTVYLDRQANGIFDCLSPDVMTEITGADILVVNNEFTYSTRGTPLAGKAYTFRAHPDRVGLLEQMGTDIVSLANNHAYDYGPDALLDTMETLRNAGIPYVGAGADLEEAMQPSYFIANGRKIAIVSATQVERSYNYTKEATEDSPGVLKTLDPEKFLTVIRKAEACADYVIVYVHWGTEKNPHFEGDQTALARAYVEAGADAIIGGHTHCLQGCQYMEDVPIIYSLGNFWFNSNTLDTGISQLVIHRDGTMDFRFLPCIQKRNITSMAEGDTWTRILNYMESISRGVTFDEEGYITPQE